MTEPTAAQRAWGERLRRRAHRLILLDPVVRQLNRELKRAIADADTFEEKIEAMRAVEDRLAEHLGIGPRPR